MNLSEKKNKKNNFGCAIYLHLRVFESVVCTTALILEYDTNRFCPAVQEKISCYSIFFFSSNMVCSVRYLFLCLDHGLGLLSSSFTDALAKKTN
jgi:hypothetical protein